MVDGVLGRWCVDWMIAAVPLVQLFVNNTYVRWIPHLALQRHIGSCHATSMIMIVIRRDLSGFPARRAI